VRANRQEKQIQAAISLCDAQADAVSSLFRLAAEASAILPSSLYCDCAESGGYDARALAVGVTRSFLTQL
jgi:hypothetical protein